MKNISLNKESIELIPGIKYIIIDGLYVNDIRQEFLGSTSDVAINEIKDKVFYYTDTPFAEYIPIEATFTLDQIKKVHYTQTKSEHTNVFSTDSGMLVLVNEKLLVDLAFKFDFNELLNSSTQLLDLEYWRSIVNGYNPLDVAIILTPGIGAGVDFDGSGLYEVL